MKMTLHTRSNLRFDALELSNRGRQKSAFNSLEGTWARSDVPVSLARHEFIALGGARVARIRKNVDFLAMEQMMRLSHIGDMRRGRMNRMRQA